LSPLYLPLVFVDESVFIGQLGSTEWSV